MMQKNQSLINKHYKIQLIILSLLIFLFAANSIAGITFYSKIYIAKELYSAFLPNDYINLIFGVPYLLISVFLLFKNKKFGFLMLFSGMLFVFYNTTAYLYSVRNTFSLLTNSAIIIFILSEVYLLLRSVDFSVFGNINQRLKAPRLYGYILSAFGAIFLARALNNILGTLAGTAALTTPEIGVNISDFLISIIWIISGIFMILRKIHSHIFGAISYLHGSALFFTLIIFMSIQPMLCDTKFISADFFVILAMSCTYFIPTFILLRKST